LIGPPGRGVPFRRGSSEVLAFPWFSRAADDKGSGVVPTRAFRHWSVLIAVPTGFRRVKCHSQAASQRLPRLPAQGYKAGDMFGSLVRVVGCVPCLTSPKGRNPQKHGGCHVFSRRASGRRRPLPPGGAAFSRYRYGGGPCLKDSPRPLQGSLRSPVGAVCTP